MARIGGRPRSPLENNIEKNNDVYVQALARGLSILSLFDIEHSEWSLGDISKQTGISKTTAYRMLRTLEWEGYLSFNPDTELYHIGPATIPIAYLTLSDIGFSRLVHPVLEKLAEATGETIELAVEGKGGAVVVDHVATSHPFKPNLPLGRVLRNLSNSSMKIFVAYRPEEDRIRAIHDKHIALTTNTKTTPKQINEELEQVHKSGLAYDIEEQDIGVCAISAPVFGVDKEVKAVVTIVTPADRFTQANRKRYEHEINATAAELSGYIGHSQTS